MAAKMSTILRICMKFCLRACFGIADFEFDVKMQRFQIEDPIWQTNFENIYIFVQGV